MSLELLPPETADVCFDRPITSPQEALVLGNGDLGALVMVASHATHIVLGKNDCWDARFDDYQVENHLLRHYDVVRIVEEYGWSWPVPDDRSHGVPDPTSEKPLPEGLIIPPHHSRYHKQGRYSSPTPKRVAEIIVEHPGLSSTRVDGGIHLADGLFSVTYTYSENKALTIETFVHAEKNVVYVRLIPKGDIPWLRVIVRKNPDAVDNTMPAPMIEALEGGVTRLGQKVPGSEGYEPLEWHVASRMPWGSLHFAYEVWSESSLKDGQGAEFSVAVATSRECEDPAARCVVMLDESNAGSWEIGKPAHDEWWRSFWGKSAVRLRDKDLEAEWYRDLYGLACNMRQGVNAPGLNGNMILWDGIIWHSDYHFNCNIQKPFIPVIPANHVELGMVALELIEYCLPTWRWIARNAYGVEGAMLELSWFPYQPYDRPYFHPFWRELGTLSWSLQAVWWLWEYTHDRNLLRERIYPAI